MVPHSKHGTQSPDAIYGTGHPNPARIDHADTPWRVRRMQFASGPVPLQVQKEDLKPEVSEGDAHAAIGRVTAAFIDTILKVRAGPLQRARQ
jgi:hypothetical protein